MSILPKVCAGRLGGREHLKGKETVNGKQKEAIKVVRVEFKLKPNALPIILHIHKHGYLDFCDRRVIYANINRTMSQRRLNALKQIIHDLNGEFHLQALSTFA